MTPPLVLECGPEFLRFSEPANKRDLERLRRVIEPAYGHRVGTLISATSLPGSKIPCRLRTTTGTFIWKTEHAGDPDLPRLIQLLAETLCAGGVRTPRSIVTVEGQPSIAFYDTAEHFGMLSEYHANRPFAGSLTDFLHLADDLARLHEIFSDSEIRQIVVRSAHQRQKAVEGQALVERIIKETDEIPDAGLAAWTRDNRKVLHGLSEDFEPLLHGAGREQTVHGDLHPGNIGFDGSGAVFFDLGTATQSQLSVAADLAKIVFRLCLYAERSHGIELRVGTFLNRYERAGGSGVTGEELLRMWVQLCFDNVARGLQTAREGKVPAPLAEFEKMARYIANAERLRRFF